MTVNLDEGKGGISSTKLSEVTEDLQSLYQERAKAVFSFRLDLKLQELEELQAVQVGFELHIRMDQVKEVSPRKQ